jgi:hypothetical protein
LYLTFSNIFLDYFYVYQILLVTRSMAVLEGAQKIGGILWDKVRLIFFLHTIINILSHDIHLYLDLF